MSENFVNDVDVVLCVRNSESILQECLDGLWDNAISPSQVIVVDGMSSDLSANIASNQGCNVTSDDGAGFVAARTLGIGLTTREFVLILGPDDKLLPGAIADLVSLIRLSKYTAAVQAGQTVPLHRTDFLSSGMRTYYRRQPRGQVPVVGNPTLYRGRLLRDVRYDSAFSSNEDTDWCTRVRSMGYEVLRSQQDTTIEIEVFSFTDFRKRWQWYGQGDIQYIKKYWRNNLRLATRHAFHPFREYVLRLGLGAAIRGDLKGLAFFVLCAVYRYAGLLASAPRRQTALGGR